MSRDLRRAAAAQSLSVKTNRPPNLRLHPEVDVDGASPPMLLHPANPTSVCTPNSASPPLPLGASTSQRLAAMSRIGGLSNGRNLAASDQSALIVAQDDSPPQMDQSSLGILPSRFLADSTLGASLNDDFGSLAISRAALPTQPPPPTRDESVFKMPAGLPPKRGTDTAAAQKRTVIPPAEAVNRLPSFLMREESKNMSIASLAPRDMTAMTDTQTSFSWEKVLADMTQASQVPVDERGEEVPVRDEGTTSFSSRNLTGRLGESFFSGPVSARSTSLGVPGGEAAAVAAGRTQNENFSDYTDASKLFACASDASRPPSGSLLGPRGFDGLPSQSDVAFSFVADDEDFATEGAEGIINAAEKAFEEENRLKIGVGGADVTSCAEISLVNASFAPAASDSLSLTNYFQQNTSRIGELGTILPPEMRPNLGMSCIRSPGEKRKSAQSSLTHPKDTTFTVSSSSSGSTIKPIRLSESTVPSERSSVGKSVRSAGGPQVPADELGKKLADLVGGLDMKSLRSLISKASANHDPVVYAKLITEHLVAAKTGDERRSPDQAADLSQFLPSFLERTQEVSSPQPPQVEKDRAQSSQSKIPRPICAKPPPTLRSPSAGATSTTTQAAQNRPRRGGLRFSSPIKEAEPATKPSKEGPSKRNLFGSATSGTKENQGTQVPTPTLTASGSQAKRKMLAALQPSSSSTLKPGSRSPTIKVTAPSPIALDEFPICADRPSITWNGSESVETINLRNKCQQTMTVKAIIRESDAFRIDGTQRDKTVVLPARASARLAIALVVFEGTTAKGTLVLKPQNVCNKNGQMFKATIPLILDQQPLQVETTLSCSRIDSTIIAAAPAPPVRSPSPRPSSSQESTAGSGRVYLDRETVCFPTARPHERVHGFVVVNNKSSSVVSFKCTRNPNPPFALSKEPHFVVKPKAYLRYPVAFRPPRIGQFAEHVVFESDGRNKIHLKVKLVGKCFDR